MRKFLLIDGNNLAFRTHWTHRQLTINDVPVSLLYGFFNSLISLKKNYPEYGIIIAWDGGYKRRFIESAEAVISGMIPTPYKATRANVIERVSSILEEKGWTPQQLHLEDRDDDDNLDIESMFAQMPTLKEALKLARVIQVVVKDAEADDVIFTYAKKIEEMGGGSIAVTSDEDYYQLISDKTFVFDAMKSNFWTRKVFVDSYGFEPELWVDVGALSGDKSDTIHGVPGVGPKYAVKFVKEYGDIDAVLKGLAEKPKRGKKEDAVLEHKERLYLAKSLKKMDMLDIQIQTKIAPRDKDALIEWFGQYQFKSLVPNAWRLV